MKNRLFKNKHTNFICALFSVLITLLSLMPMISSTYVYASDNEFEGPIYSNIYYFTDYEGSKYYCRDFLNDYIDLYKYQNPNFGEFFYEYVKYDYEKYMYYNNYYNVDIAEDNSLVIVEYSGQFYNLITSGNYTVYECEEIYCDFFNKLSEAFENLKRRGCTVVFICDTDEERFSDYAGFLDYVDMHINTDKLYLFMTSVIYLAENSGYAPTFFLSEWFHYDNYIRDWFFPYYMRMYQIPNDPYSPYDYYFIDNLQNKLEADNIQLILQEGGILTDWVSGKTLNIIGASNDYYLQEFLNYKTEGFFPMGWAFPDNFKYFLEFFSDLYKLYAGQAGDFFMYGMSLSEFEFEAMTSNCDYSLDIFHCNTGRNFLNDHYYNEGTEVYEDETNIQKIFYSLLFETDWTEYNNWTGICDISYKATFIGDGWMTGHNDPECWKLNYFGEF